MAFVVMTLLGSMRTCEFHWPLKNSALKGCLEEEEGFICQWKALDKAVKRLWNLEPDLGSNPDTVTK